MEIYYFGTNGEKVGPVTKEGLSKLIESGVVVESTKLQVNGKQYIAGQIPTIAQLINRQNAFPNDPLSPPKPGDRQTSNNHEQASKTNSFARKFGHIYGAASKHGFAPKLRPTIDSGDPIFNNFWKSYGIFKTIINFIFFLAAIFLTIGSIVFLIASIVLFFKEGFDMNFLGRGLLDLVLTAVAFALLYITYRLILMPYYWMGSMVRSAEDTRVMKKLLEEKLNSMEQSD